MSPLPETYRLKSDVRFRLLQGEAVVLRQDEAEVLVLNEVGSRILQLLADGRSRERLIEALLEEFEVSADELDDDVTEFVAVLDDRGVIDRVTEVGDESDE